MLKSLAAALVLTISLARGETPARAVGEDAFGPKRPRPNLADHLARPLRYHPDGADFVIENGSEFFNRSLYGGNTAFRVDGGDKPEFVLYLPGRGGNLRLGIRAGTTSKWLNDAARIVTRYRPGMLLYEIQDPVLGAGVTLRLSALAYADTEGLVVRAELSSARADTNDGAVSSARTDTQKDAIELLWAYGGVNGQRGKRDGDIGTENVPISEWFQLKPEFCAGNAFSLGSGQFTLHAKAATIFGVMPANAKLAIADAAAWHDPDLLFAKNGSSAAQPDHSQWVGRDVPASRTSSAHPPRNRPPTVPSHSSHDASTSTSENPPHPIIIGRAPLEPGQTLFLSLQRLNPDTPNQDVGNNADLPTYREVSNSNPRESASRPSMPRQAPAFTRDELPQRFRDAERHFREMRQRVRIDTPDTFIDAAAGALNVAADAAWDEPQHAIMHGAIAWRTKLLGWRGPYVLDELGWHERARQHFVYWASRQNTDPIPDHFPPADEKSNLARNEAGLHSNGDMSRSHYDMNLVYIDALFRHLAWTGDLALARDLWPVIERHLAWERRLFRREFGPEKLPLYEAYAAIWASDDLQYHGGGVAHATAYNYYHNRQAARLARLLGKDPAPYEKEADLIARGMRELLWRKDGGGFAEFKDFLGLQRVHDHAALWTFYHTMDSELPTPSEAWEMTQRVEREIPFLPVTGDGVPENLAVPATSNWMPYRWSINNVVMSEITHAALGFWQAGRPEEASRMTEGSVLAAMFMGISPGNVGSMSYLDVYRRESQRDFADGSGTFSRALIEGLFGIKPDVLAGTLHVSPGFPSAWNHASLHHPDISLRFTREGKTDHYVITQRFPKQLSLQLQLSAPFEDVASLSVNGDPASWRAGDAAAAPAGASREGAPRNIIIESPPSGRHEILITWAGQPTRREVKPLWSNVPDESSARNFNVSDESSTTASHASTESSPSAAYAMRGLGPIALPADTRLETVDLTKVFNDRVTQIFRNEYRSPRSPFVSLAIPKQGIGGWANGVNVTAEIDDTGLRATAAKNHGKIILPNNVPFATPTAAGARNIVFTSQWDNYPRQVEIPLHGRARAAFLLMAGSTNHMQSHFENGEVIVTYADGTTQRLALENPSNWWPIEQDYFIDDYQFRRPAPLPTRVDLKTGEVRVPDPKTFKGQGGIIPGGAATVLSLPLDPNKELRSLTVSTLANEVVIGLMAATLALR
ncbi:MAG TPA: DUF4450 domain-containing protein [Opitutaceae bacterium]|nr:DUF4450 domain-containing protein [Opitutaceae bacterium]